MQERWIGRSEGARVRFPIVGRADALEVFTTRPDTLFGASFMALAPDHPLAAELAAADSGVAAFAPSAPGPQPARRRSSRPRR